MERFESEVRAIENNLSNPGLADYDRWDAIEGATFSIVEGLKDAPAEMERRAMIEMYSFMALVGNQMELGGGSREFVT